MIRAKVFSCEFFFRNSANNKFKLLCIAAEEATRISMSSVFNLLSEPKSYEAPDCVRNYARTSNESKLR